jgi:hypothetical protein
MVELKTPKADEPGRSISDRYTRAAAHGSAPFSAVPSPPPRPRQPPATRPCDHKHSEALTGAADRKVDHGEEGLVARAGLLAHRLRHERPPLSPVATRLPPL